MKAARFAVGVGLWRLQLSLNQIQNSKPQSQLPAYTIFQKTAYGTVIANHIPKVNGLRLAR